MRETKRAGVDEEGDVEDEVDKEGEGKDSASCEAHGERKGEWGVATTWTNQSDEGTIVNVMVEVIGSPRTLITKIFDGFCHSRVLVCPRASTGRTTQSHKVNAFVYVAMEKHSACKHLHQEGTNMEGLQWHACVCR